MNIRSLTKQKLLFHKATESLTGFSPDIYIFTESKFSPKEQKILQHKTTLHNCQETGQGGTTIIINNKRISIVDSDTNISDTVFLTIQVGKTTTIRVGTYFHHRIKDKSQRLRLIIEELSNKASKYKNPNILVFGDLNMKPSSRKNFQQLYKRQ